MKRISIMEYRKVNEEIYYPATPNVIVAAKEIEYLKQKTLENQRRRARFCTHMGVDDALHEMLIVHTSHTYVRPHLHHNKVESLHIIEGEAALLLFEQDGTIAEWIELGDYVSGKPFYCRISEPRYHMLLIRSSFIVFHEVTNGPFRQADTVYAPWSPCDSDYIAIEEYLQQLKLKKDKFSYQAVF